MPTRQARNREALYNPMTIKELDDATGNKVRIFVVMYISEYISTPDRLRN